MARLPRRAAEGAGGKLIAVASRWASGRGGGGKTSDDAYTAASADAIAAIEARRAGRRRPEGIEIGPDEYEAVRLFYALGTQWQVHPATGTRLGLNYGVVPQTAGMMNMTMTPALFDDLGTMERAALAVFAR